MRWVCLRSWMFVVGLMILRDDSETSPRAPRAFSWFDQNRAYAAVGFELKPTLRLETGYMNQTLLARNGSRLEFNHTLMVSFFSTAAFGKR